MNCWRYTLASYVGQIKLADYIPEYGMTGDFKKISEYEFLQYNSIILPVISILSMEKGTNQLIPDMGLRDELLKLPFSEITEISSVLSAISKQMTKYFSTPITCELGSDSDLKNGEVTIEVHVGGIPQPLKVMVNKDSNLDKNFRIVKPSALGIK